VKCGGERVTPSDPSLANGYYLSPCVMVDVRDDMQIAREEVFGAVACLFKFSTEEEVLRRANDSELGLAAGVFTKWVLLYNIIGLMRYEKISNASATNLSLSRY